MNRSLRVRWCHIAQMMRDGESLPSVDLIAMHLGYFVRDSNHRVSVAHVLGLHDIDARIAACEM